MYLNCYHSTPISNLRFLVTGGAGFIGSNIVEYLLKQGALSVRVLDNLSTGYMENIHEFSSLPNFEFIKGDICDLATCMKACDGVDVVIHQAALGSVPRSISDPIGSHQSNVDGFVNMLFAAKESKVKRFVYASSSSVYGDHPVLPKVEHQIGRQISPYAVTKYTNELYASIFNYSYGLEVIGLRYFNVFGPKQSPQGPYAAVIPLFIEAIHKNESPMLNGEGKQTRDFTFVENAVQANIRAATTPNPEAINKVYNVAFGESYSLLQLVEAINKVLGKQVPAKHREPRAGDIQDSLADISLARNLLGYDPLFNFSKGLEITANWFVKSYSN